MLKPSLFAVSLTVVAAGVLAAAAPAHASALQDVLCGIKLLVQGDLARGIATVAVCGLGIGAFLGRINWGLALTVAGGFSIALGANALLGAIGVDVPC